MIDYLIGRLVAPFSTELIFALATLLSHCTSWRAALAVSFVVVSLSVVAGIWAGTDLIFRLAFVPVAG